MSSINETENNRLDVCPNCGGVADNGHDRCLPPSPYWCSKCTQSPPMSVDFEEWRKAQDPSQLRAETAWQTIERAFKDGYRKGAFSGAAAMQERCAIDYDKLAEAEATKIMTVDDMAHMIARYFAGHTYNINEFIECIGLALYNEKYKGER